MRLRKKTWRSPGSIYLDHQMIDRDLYVYPGTEMYVEALSGRQEIFNKVKDNFELLFQAV